jgi:hypothetical protein
MIILHDIIYYLFNTAYGNRMGVIIMYYLVNVVAYCIKDTNNQTNCI